MPLLTLPQWLSAGNLVSQMNLLEFALASTNSIRLHSSLAVCSIHGSSLRRSTQYVELLTILARCLASNEGGPDGRTHDKKRH